MQRRASSRCGAVIAPVALLMGCRMGRWTLLDLKSEQQAIAEAGVRNPESGFAAVVSAAGYMTTAEAASFSQAFGGQIAAGAGMNKFILVKVPFHSQQSVDGIVQRVIIGPADQVEAQLLNVL